MSRRLHGKNRQLLPGPGAPGHADLPSVALAWHCMLGPCLAYPWHYILGPCVALHTWPTRGITYLAHAWHYILGPFVALHTWPIRGITYLVHAWHYMLGPGKWPRLARIWTCDHSQQKPGKLELPGLACLAHAWPTLVVISNRGIALLAHAPPMPGSCLATWLCKLGPGKWPRLVRIWTCDHSQQKHCCPATSLARLGPGVSHAGHAHWVLLWKCYNS